MLIGGELNSVLTPESFIVPIFLNAQFPSHLLLDVADGMEDELGLRLKGVGADAAAVIGGRDGGRGWRYYGHRLRRRCSLPARTCPSLDVLLEFGPGGKIAPSAPDAAEHAAGHVVSPLVKVSSVLKLKYLNQGEGSDGNIHTIHMAN